MTAAKLTTGRQYNEFAVLDLFAGWATKDGTTDHLDGYAADEYFRDGVYLGPDEYGVEPLFSC